MQHIELHFIYSTLNRSVSRKVLLIHLCMSGTFPCVDSLFLHSCVTDVFSLLEQKVWPTYLFRSFLSPFSQNLAVRERRVNETRERIRMDGEAIWEIKSMSVFDLLLINPSLCLRLEMSPCLSFPFFLMTARCPPTHHQCCDSSCSLSTLPFLSKDYNFQEACTHSPHLLAFYFLPCDVLIEWNATVLFLWPTFPLVSSLISWCEFLFLGRVGNGKKAH